MKNLLLLFISCFLLFQSSDVISQTKKVQVKNDLMEENMKGKVKSIKQAVYPVDGWSSREIPKDLMMDTTFKNLFFEIDTAYKLEDSTYSFKVSPEVVFNYIDSVRTIKDFMSDQHFSKEFWNDTTYTKYDLKGNIIEGYEEFFCEVGCMVKWETIIVYDREDKKIKQTTTGSSYKDIEGEITFKYYNNGNKIEQNRYISKNNKVKSTFIYDSNGKQIEYHKIKDYGYYTVDVEKDTFIYDSIGFIIKRNNYSGGDLYSKSLIKFNKLGLKIKGIEYKPHDSFVFKPIFKYDTIGLKIKENKYNPNDSIISNSIFKYDSFGNLIEEYSSVPKYNVQDRWQSSPIYRYTYKYEYDNLGNWIYRIEFHNKVASEFSERVIEYYEK